ncbi:hypothetical protein P8864_03690 [Priestia flexa]|uniref:hypothetical protein n=1 Tax=Priestia flexa TaxID=86664 RepID=UPI002DBE1417|nr:hypothetical protein [Priestia flexa]MEC0665061.1 hypothetical protein [Priestia flexa]MED3825830.1 hypothetical protein [Priestia flexa]
MTSKILPKKRSAINSPNNKIHKPSTTEIKAAEKLILKIKLPKMNKMRKLHKKVMACEKLVVNFNSIIDATPIELTAMNCAFTFENLIPKKAIKKNINEKTSKKVPITSTKKFILILFTSLFLIMLTTLYGI